MCKGCQKPANIVRTPVINRKPSVTRPVGPGAGPKEKITGLKYVPK